LQNPSQIIGDNLQNLRQETRRIFRNKKREYLKGKINELETNNKNKSIRDLYRGINEFKKGYQPRINIIMDENGNLLVDPQSVLNKWKHFFNRVLNVNGVHNVRQKDIQTAEPLASEPSFVKMEIAIGKLKSYKFLGTDQIQAKLIKAWGEILCSEIYKLICSKWNKEDQFIERVIRLTVIIIEKAPSYQLPTKILSKILLARLTPYFNVVGDHQHSFCHNRSTMDQIFYIRQILEKNGV
jgi:hypothetical protein